MIQNVVTISEAFVQLLENLGVATFGQDLFINEVPDSQNTQDSVYWLLTSGGSPIAKNKTGEIVRLNAITVYYRSKRTEAVEKTLFQLNELLSQPGCIALTGFEVVDVSVSQFPAQADIDLEDRKTGLLQINIQTYKRSA